MWTFHGVVFHSCEALSSISPQCPVFRSVLCASEDRDTPKHCNMSTLASSERPKRLEIKIADVFKQKKIKTQLNIIIVYRKKNWMSILKSMMRVVLLKIQHSFHMSTIVLKAWNFVWVFKFAPDLTISFLNNRKQSTMLNASTQFCSNIFHRNLNVHSWCAMSLLFNHPSLIQGKYRWRALFLNKHRFQTLAVWIEVISHLVC